MNVAKSVNANTVKQPLAEVYGQYPFEIVRGCGMELEDTNGKKYLDFYGGHAVSIVGHSPAPVAEAIYRQAKTMMFHSNLVRIPIREEGAAKLLSFANNGMDRVFFCNSGGEANENALKIAIKLTGRSKIVSYRGSFHGRTMLAIGATDHADWHEYLRGWMGPTAQIVPNDLAGLEQIDKDTAAVILEPIQSIGGVTVFQKDYLQALRAKSEAVGAKLIFDEVQTGMGRTGVPFVSGWSGVLPDMMTLAKGIAGGFAMGAVVMKEEVYAGLKVGDIAATFGGGPMAVAAMMATIDMIESGNLLENAQRFEAQIRKDFASVPQIKEIRGAGCLMGLVMDRPAKNIQQALFAEGIIVGLNSNPNLVHLLPPLMVNSSQTALLKQKLQQVLQ